MHVPLSVYIRLCMCVCVCPSVCVYIHTNIHTHVCTHGVHTHTHTHRSGEKLRQQRQQSQGARDLILVVLQLCHLLPHFGDITIILPILSLIFLALPQILGPTVLSLLVQLRKLFSKKSKIQHCAHPCVCGRLVRAYSGCWLERSAKGAQARAHTCCICFRVQGSGHVG